MKSWGGAVQQAEPVGSEKKLLGRDVAHDVRRRWLQPARPDILEGNVELELLGFGCVDGCGSEDIAFLPIHAPQPSPILDHGAGGKRGLIYLGDDLIYHIQPLLSATLLEVPERGICVFLDDWQKRWKFWDLEGGSPRNRTPRAG
jgi:hypothetical protein